MRTSVLVVDDDMDISQLVIAAFTKAGYQVRHAKDADKAFGLLKDASFDLVLLDLELPGISGFKLLEILRQDPRTAGVPVIMLTVLGDETNKVRGLKSGADDYLGKPFSTKELLARAEALLRRVQRGGQPQTILEAGGVTVNLDLHEVTALDKRVVLTPIEFELLAHLLRRKAQVLSYQTLSEALSKGSQVMSSESLYVHVNNLRRKLGTLGKLIETIHGIGYKFAP